MTVRFHPARERPGVALGFALLVGMVAGGSYHYLNQPLVAAGATLIFACQFGRLFFSTEYRLGTEGLEVVHLGRQQVLSWDRFLSFEWDRNGIFLSPFRKRHHLDLIRGRFLPMNAESVRALLPTLRRRYAERP